MEKIFPECQGRFYLSVLVSLRQNQISFSVMSGFGSFSHTGHSVL